MWLILKKIRVFVIYKFFKKTTYGVRTIITDHKSIFLVKHPYDSFWVLPGGGQNKNESAYDTAKRECEEEAGLVIFGDYQILGKYFNNKDGKNDYVTIVIAEKWEKSIKKRRLIDRIEIEKGEWFKFDCLPKISLSTKKRINEYTKGEFSKEIRSW